MLNPWYAVLYRRLNQWVRRGIYSVDTPIRRRLYDQKREIAINEVLTDAQKIELQRINWKLGNGGAYRFTPAQRQQMSDMARAAVAKARGGGYRMKIEEYTAPPPTADDTPRRNASQFAARAKRARAVLDQDAPANGVEVPVKWVYVGLFGGMLLFIVALTWQLGQPARPLALTPVPTQAPTESARLFTTSSEKPPAPTSAPIAPDPSPTLAPPATPPLQPAQSGRGLGAIATPEPQIAPSYIENVGAQVRHSPRGGLCGPTGGDCAPGVPFGLDNSQYIANVGAQKPHKIR